MNKINEKDYLLLVLKFSYIDKMISNRLPRTRSFKSLYQIIYLTTKIEGLSIVYKNCIYFNIII